MIVDRLAGHIDDPTRGWDGKFGTKCDEETYTNAYPFPDISGSGRYLSFATCAKNVLRRGTNAEGETYDHVVVRDLGPDLGTGGVGPWPRPGTNPPPPNEICIPSVGCLRPPGGFASTSDEAGDAVRDAAGADLIGASVAYRPQLGDLYLVQDLDRLGDVGPTGVGIPGVLHGFRFTANGTAYEVRTSGTGFALFRCGTESAAACTKAADLSGGFGTTGERVVVALPLSALGLAGGGELSDVEAFTALGTVPTGPVSILDLVRLK